MVIIELLLLLRFLRYSFESMTVGTCHLVHSLNFFFFLILS